MSRSIIVAIALVVGVAGAGGTVLAQQEKSKNPVPATAERSLLGKLNISGNPSTLVACTGGQYYNTHNLGFAPARSRIRVDVTSGDGIDPMATLLILQMGPNAPSNARTGYVFDDDSGGGRDPRLDFTTTYDGNVILNVGSYDGTFGCYFVKVEVTVP